MIKNTSAIMPEIMSLNAFETYTPSIPKIFGKKHSNGKSIPPYLSTYRIEVVFTLDIDWKYVVEIECKPIIGSPKRKILIL